MNIDELLDKPHDDLSTRLENWVVENSDWSVHLILRHQLVISNISPCEGSSYFT